MELGLGSAMGLSWRPSFCPFPLDALGSAAEGCLHPSLAQRGRNVELRSPRHRDAKGAAMVPEELTRPKGAPGGHR